MKTIKLGVGPQNFNLYAGETKKLVITIRDEDENLVDLTGASIAWTMGSVHKSTDDGSISIVGLGVMEILLSSSDTATPGSSKHECRMTDSQGNVVTLFTGEVNIRTTLHTG